MSSFFYFPSKSGGEWHNYSPSHDYFGIDKAFSKTLNAALKLHLVYATWYLGLVYESYFGVFPRGIVTH